MRRRVGIKPLSHLNSTHPNRSFPGKPLPSPCHPDRSEAQWRDLQFFHGNRSSGRAPPFPLSSRPKRTRISYFALLATTACAALRKESRMQIIKATGLHGKSGGAQWRDLRFSGPFLEMFFLKRSSSRPGRLVIGVVIGCLFRRRLDRRKCPGDSFSMGAPLFGQFLPQQPTFRKSAISPPCHPDRSVPGFPTSRCWPSHVCGFP